jgi:hypothetical protein
MGTDRPVKQRYLVCYDYGQGGVWAFFVARSPQEIRSKYPELIVATERLPWMTDEWIASIEKRPSYDLDRDPEGLLAAILKQRRR